MSQRPPRTGTFLGLPYDWRPPTLSRIKERWWNPNDRRIFTPKMFGWGLDINLYELFRRLDIVGNRRSEDRS